ncbi:MAG: glycosyltransferase [Pyrinomonadaceae bacterium]
MKTLSIVIIGRNEEKSIGACIDAAQRAGELFVDSEIIYVDSDSTDDTVSVARSRQTTVIPMDPNSRLCPSAGRFVGANHAQGEFILFLDADTMIYEDFLSIAIERLENNPQLAGVNGRIDDLNERGETIDYEQRYDDVVRVKWHRGPACLYRRLALIEVGSFNPLIAMEEEAELGLRLLRNGWRLELIPVPMACHTRCYHVDTVSAIISTFKRDAASGRLGEITKTIVYAYRAGNGLAFCWLRLQTTILFFLWMLVTLFIFLLPNSLLSSFLFWTIIFVGLFGIFLKKRNIKQTLLFIPNKILNLIDIFAGVPKVLFLK